ncbi:MAG TPA: hypothetical protein PLE74_00340 [Candidatus Cloacimonadota bacterium]|nr:hypothetical protein [Candidatus Cloacimonadota bacterium]HPT70708.1 hypothetical protein [Candidatus Cloacimonadota bacterium]
MKDLFVEITPQRAGELIEKISKFIAERHMAPAAIMAIESLRPLHSISSQLMYFMLPIAEILFDSKGYQEFAAMLDNDEYVSMLVKRIDEIDEEMHSEERRQAAILRNRKRNQLRQWFKRIIYK